MPIKFPQSKSAMCVLIVKGILVKLKTSTKCKLTFFIFSKAFPAHSFMKVLCANLTLNKTYNLQKKMCVILGHSPSYSNCTDKIESIFGTNLVTPKFKSIDPNVWYKC